MKETLLNEHEGIPTCAIVLASAMHADAQQPAMMEDFTQPAARLQGHFGWHCGCCRLRMRRTRAGPTRDVRVPVKRFG